MSSWFIRRANVSAVGSGPTPRLPDTFTELAYIEGTGSQYIDTGKVFNSNYTYKFKFKKSSANNVPFAGYRTGSGATSGQNCSFTYVSSYLGLYYATGSTSSNNTLLCSNNTNEHIVVLNPSNSILTLDGESRWSASFLTSEVISSRNFYIFNDNRPSMTTGMSGRFYYYQVYNGSTLVQDLVPAKRKADDVVGMYDLVSGSFLTNAGSGSFSYGELQGVIVIMTDNAKNTKKDFRERYKRITQSKGFKEAYDEKSLGESISIN